jgi:hypothetical protein
MKTLLALAFALLSTSAFAAGIANDMSCSQAQNYYNSHGRIYVRTNGTVVPIYGLVRYCGGGETASPYWVRTADGVRCVLGYRCYENHGGR